MASDVAGAEHHRVVVVGTGFAGLGAAIRLLGSGEGDVVLLERADDVGGCWRDNTYPGLQCDVPSVVYAFSFAPEPGWTRTFAPGDEIRAYLRRCAEEHGLLPRIRFGTEVLDASWDEAAGLWRVATSRGAYTAEVLLAAHGAMSEPVTPDLPGLSSFAGPVFHSARWRHDVSLDGKRVAVVGTGASAIQIVPAIQGRVGVLQVYQRTPAWVLPRPDHVVGDLRKAIRRALPWTGRVARAVRFLRLETRVLGILTAPGLMRAAEWRARRFLASQVPDVGLRDALTPRYAMGCKRILLSNDYYRALAAPNVELVQHRIREVTPTAVVAEDGRTREADVLVLCTGYAVTDHPFTRRIRGRGGRTLREAWAGGARALLGMTVPGFPNLFLLLTGPHTGLGHNSMVAMLEAQLIYLCGALAEQRARGGAAMEVRGAAVDAFTDEMQRRLRGTVWGSGCGSYYLDASGRNVAIWPGFATTYRWRTRRFDPGRYVFTTRSAPARARRDAATARPADGGAP